MDTETRTTTAGIECRSSQGRRSIGGVAMPYGSVSENLGGFFEVFNASAFKNGLDRDVCSLFNHDASKLLGRQSSGTMTVEDTPTSLNFSISLPDTQTGWECWELAKRGDLKSASVGFYSRADDWKEQGSHEGLPLRMIMEAELIEISLVAMPAYPGATVAPQTLRSLRALSNSLTHNLGTFGAAARRRRMRMIEVGA